MYKAMNFKMLSRWRIHLLLLAVLLASPVYAQNMPALVSLAKTGDWQRLETLLRDGFDPNIAYGDGSTALHWASYHNKLDAVTLLLGAGANVNAATDLGVTALWLAAENANAAISRELLQAGADPSIVLLSGESAVMIASQTGNAEVVRLLLEAGGDANTAVTRGQTALMWAASEGHSEAVVVLLEYGADVDARTALRTQYVKSEKEQDSHPDYKVWRDVGGNTALSFAAAGGNYAAAQLLIMGGSDTNGLSADGSSPAIMAVHGGNADLLNYLLNQGADADAAAGGHTALHAAVLRGNLAAVEVLLAHDADLEAVLLKSTPARRQSTDYNFHDALIGATPLWLAARFSEPLIMQALIDAGADTTSVNRVSYPAQRQGENYIAEEGDISLLMAAVGMGYRRLRMSWGTPERRAGQLEQSRESLVLDAVRIAVQAGVALEMRDAEGRTALDFATQRRYASVVSFLQLAAAE